MSSKKRKIWILGGGISALSLADRLLDLVDWEVSIIEKSNNVGGVAGSFKWGCFDYNDFGPHIWHTPDKSTLNYWKQNFGDLFHESDFWGHNLVGDPPGQIFDYPLSHESIDKLPGDLRHKITLELNDCSEEKRASAKDFKQYVEALVGPTLTKMFFIKYPEKLWGVSTSEMTANWAPKRIFLTEKSQQFHRDQWAAVGRQGSGTILKRLEKSVVEKGLNILRNTEVCGIKTKDQLIREIIVNGGSSIKVGANDIIVSTIPLNKFGKFLGISNNLKFRGAHLVYLHLNKAVCLPGKSAFLYFSQPDLIFHRVSEQKKFCSHGWPKEKTHIVAEIAFNEEDLEVKNSNFLVDETINGLVRYKLLAKEEVVESTVISLPHVYPLLTKEKEVELSQVLSKIQNFSQVYLIGTGGEYHYADIQILFAKAKDLAERIVSEKNLKITANSASSYKKEKVTFFSETPFIIAEIGLNHGGSLGLAKQLMKEAKDAGVEYVKFQTYKSENRISNQYRMKNYVEEVADLEESIFQTLKKCELSESSWREIFRYGDEIKLKVFSTPFDIESLNLLEELGCSAYKVASMDVNNYPLLKSIASLKKPVILSSGMSNLGEIEKALEILQPRELPEFILLHCVSSYPAIPDILNLKLIETLGKSFGVRVGYSDHSIGKLAATVALSLGAVCVEKHFTLDNNLEGPDHILSSTKNEMQELVSLANMIPKMLGSGVKRVNRQELETAYKFKKTIHAARNIKKGEIISQLDLAIKGPNAGIAPEFIDLVSGRIAREEIDKDMPIKWEFI